MALSNASVELSGLWWRAGLLHLNGLWAQQVHGRSMVVGPIVEYHLLLLLGLEVDLGLDLLDLSWG